MVGGMVGSMGGPLERDMGSSMCGVWEGGRCVSRRLTRRRMRMRMMR